jgi:hypothetical protein
VQQISFIYICLIINGGLRLIVRVYINSGVLQWTVQYNSALRFPLHWERIWMRHIFGKKDPIMCCCK